MYYNQLKELHDSGYQINDGFALQAILNQAYDITYGLFNYNSPNAHPLSSVMVHPGERLDYDTPRKQKFRRYRAAQVYKHTGLTFDQFLHRVPYQVEEMFRFCEEAEQKDVDVANNIMNNVGGQEKK